jgi:GNAT superfamily N-acetyltransferase
MFAVRQAQPEDAAWVFSIAAVKFGSSTSHRTRRQGAGKAIHLALEQKAQAWGLVALTLDSTALACPFYEKLGYRPAGAKRPRFGVLYSYPYKKVLHEG